MISSLKRWEAWSTVPKLCKHFGVCSSLFPFWESGNLMHSRQRTSTWSAFNRNAGWNVQWLFPKTQLIPVLITQSWGKLAMCGDLWSLGLVPFGLSHIPFHLDDFGSHILTEMICKATGCWISRDHHPALDENRDFLKNPNIDYITEWWNIGWLTC